MNNDRGRTWQVYGSGLVNISTNEMGVAPDTYNDETDFHLKPVPFAVAAWRNEPWEAWSDADRKAWMPYLTQYLKERSEESMAHACQEGLERQACEGLYAPIRSRDTIRVLELLPSPSQDNMSGTLHEVNLGFTWPVLDFPPSTVSLFEENRHRTKTTNFAVLLPSGRPVCYTALSYFWGPPNLDKSITINGTKREITTTLHDALLQLRHKEHSVLLWVDQICIDQGNIADKEAQIRLMGKIYSKAWNTVIWLGTASDRGAFKALEGMYEVLRYRSDGRLLEHEIEELLHPSSGEDEQAITSLRQLLAQPWFQRTWVIQEALLSQKPYFMTGHSAITFGEFSSWCRVIADATYFDTGPESKKAEDDSPGKVHIDGLQVAAQLSTLQEFARGGAEDPLVKMLAATRYAQTTNPLDKVYGILGLCYHRVSPDYSKDIVALYSEVAANVVQDAISDENLTKDKTLREPYLYRLLYSVDHGPTDGLPSWAVDWTRPRETTSLGQGALGRGYFDAGGRAPAARDIRLDADTHTLTHPALLFSTVQHLSEIFRSADLSVDDCDTGNHSLRQAVSFATSQPANSRQGVFLTLCNTLVAGKDGFDNIRYPDAFTEILSLLCDETTGSHAFIPGQSYTPRQQKGRFTTANLKARSTGRAFQSLKRAYKAAMLHRRLCWSEDGHLGLVPRHTQVRDVLCVLPGSVVPFVVRKLDGGDYMLVGECYVHDVMQGELFRDDSMSVVNLALR